MLDPNIKDKEGLPLTCRAVFIVGPDKKLKLSLNYPASVGRNMDEIMRVVDALQLSAKYSVVRTHSHACFHPIALPFILRHRNGAWACSICVGIELQQAMDAQHATHHQRQATNFGGIERLPFLGSQEMPARLLTYFIGSVAQATPANWPNNHESIGAKGWAFILPTVTKEDADKVCDCFT